MINKELIEQAFEDRSLLNDEQVKQAIKQTIASLDKGEIRVCEKNGDTWQTNQWIKKAIILYFPICNTKTMKLNDFEFADKIDTKKDYLNQGVRCVPLAIARYGSFLAKGVIMMPSYVNIGAYVDSGTMVDTWATVGSCAQIGKNVHLAGGVGIGGVLEPVGANPVIIEDHCFIGSRCIVVEGVRVCEGSVLGANTVITQSTKIIDVSGDDPKYYKAFIPKNSVVIPGSYTKHFSCGDFNMNCALIIGQRKDSTDKKTSLNQALREFNVDI